MIALHSRLESGMAQEIRCAFYIEPRTVPADIPEDSIPWGQIYGLWAVGNMRYLHMICPCKGHPGRGLLNLGCLRRGELGPRRMLAARPVRGDGPVLASHAEADVKPHQAPLLAVCDGQRFGACHVLSDLLARDVASALPGRNVESRYELHAG